MAEKLKKSKTLRQMEISRLNELFKSATLAQNDAAEIRKFSIWFEEINSIREEFNKQHATIMAQNFGTDAEMLQEVAVLHAFENVFFQIKVIYEELFPAELDTKPDTSMTESTSHVQLPKLSLIKFKGDIKAFPTFLDMFNALVHSNQALSKIEKFNYLTASLEGVPLSIVKCLPMTSANYQIAYDNLIKRYENKRLLAQAHWNAIETASKVTAEDPQAIRNLLDIFAENLGALRILKLPVDSWNFVLANILLKKLDSTLVTRYELQNQQSNLLPDYLDIYAYLEKHCNALMSVNSETPPKNRSQRKPETQKPLYSPQRTTPHYSSASFLGTSNSNINSTNLTKQCVLCKNNHTLNRCPDFLSKTVNDRFQFVKTKNLCMNCLSHSHRVMNCNSIINCRFCQNRHNSALHNHRTSEPIRGSDSNSSSRTSETVSQTSNDSGSSSSKTSYTNTAPAISTDSRTVGNFAGFSNNNTTVLLSTAVIEVLDAKGNFQTLRAVLDTGSQISFITQKCASRLGLPRSKIPREIQGIGNTQMNTHLGSVCLSVRPVGNINVNINLSAIILPKICSDMPATPLPITGWKHIENLKLADEDFSIPGPIDVLLGAEIFPTIIQSGQIHGEPNEPVAINTIFGFILMGKFVNEHSQTFNSFFCQESDSLDIILQNFWRLENVPENSALSPDDVLCEKLFTDSVQRTEDGRFIVRLPFRDDEPTFSFSKDLALRRFLSLERRLLRDPCLYNEYSKFMQEYLDLNHMERIMSHSPIENSNKRFYIPHHCVLKPDNASTKLRVVFNASARMGTDPSLNETLLVGQKLQADIINILLNFRLHEIVLCADIKKMYRQILVAPEHQDYQRIFWRFDSSLPVSEYRLKTVTYGVSSAPFLALRTLRQLAQLEENNYPRAAKILTENTFVDDICTGCPTIDDALALRTDLTLLLKKGGFDLHKWSSNSLEVLQDLPPSLVNPASLSLDPDDITKVLGLRWLPASDTFTFRVEPLDRPCTKRNILSELAKCFDPLGMLSPLTLLTKRIIQKLWTLGLDWDSCPPDDLNQLWEKYKSELPLLAKFNLPRLMNITSENVMIELHAFCDASTKGFASVIYFRICKNNSFSTYFVCSKAKVAPLRTINIHRLELCAAVLLSELILYVQTVFSGKLHFSKIYAWSDSTTALYWIKSHPYRWKTFVSNRVSLIQERVAPSLWYYVSSNHNAADIASRGVFPSELLNHSEWWTGPNFLKFSSESWPFNSELTNSATSSEVQAEEKRDVTLATTDITSNFIDILLRKYSSIFTLKRVVAYVLRFIDNLKSSSKRVELTLSSVELHDALMTIVKREQEIAFKEEISNLHKNKKLSKPFQKLCIFLDEKNILRVGGRLHHSYLSYDKKHQILLPRSSHLTELLIQDIHTKYCHAGVQSVLFLLVQQFWVISAKRTIRHVLSKCVRCFRNNPVPYRPFMGDLPSPRISEVKPFSHTGVDYGGPFIITLGKIRGAKTHKAYICLFVCMSTKALHLELASDLTTDAFIAALRRFISRRGRCSHLYCDNATNFIGANKELKSFVSRDNIIFKNIPPTGSNFGGLWEAGIKSVKTHLHRVVGSQILTYEEFYTVLCQIEAILNSRPLTPMSTDPTDLSVLTPGHFLTLEPLTNAPDVDLSTINSNKLNRWQLLQKLQQDFWRRYQQEYLHTLQQRSKWTNSSNSPKLDDIIDTLVLIKDDNCPPLQWRLGRITECFPGSDGIIRVANVRTAGGTLKRPLSKLCPLPISALEKA